jgi:Putative prokaryotic signal transducing protein
MEPKDLVPVYTAADSVKAHIVKNLLEEEGIRAFIEDENQAGVTGLPTVEVRVLVESDRAEEARNLIEPHEEQVIRDELAEMEEEDEEDVDSTGVTTPPSA